MAIVVGPATAPSQAQEIGDDGYPHRNAPNASGTYEWGNPPWDDSGFYKRNCTSYVGWALREVNGVKKFDNEYKLDEAERDTWGNAQAWDNAARDAGIPVDNQPARGAVAQWEGRYGHVAWVSDVRDGGDTIVVEEYNRFGNGAYNSRELSRGTGGRHGVAGWPDAFIHVDDREQSPDTPATDYAGTMVRNRENGAVYLVKADGRRYWVPSGGDYQALRNNGIPLQNLSPAQIEQIPNSGQRATVERQDEPHISGPSRWIVDRNNTPYGFADDYRLTQSAAGNASTTNTATWNFDVPDNGVYRVKIYVPKREAVAHVVYDVFDGDRLVARVPVAQRQEYGFTTLTERHFDSNIKVRLRDNSGNGPYGSYMGYDLAEVVPIR